MIDKIIEFYTKELSVNKETNFLFYTITFLLIADGILGIIEIIYAQMQKALYIPFLVLIVLITIAIGVMFYFLLKKGNELIKIKFGITETNLFKRSNDMFQVKKEKMYVFLKRNDLCSLKKVDRLINLLDKEVNRKKRQFIIPGITLALTLPIWNQFVMVIFKPVQTFSYEQALKYGALVTVIIIFLAFIIVYTLSAIREVTSTVKETIINESISNIKYITRILEDISLELSESNDTNLSGANR